MVSNLLIEGYTLNVKPQLAVVVGLNEAIILQQIQYWTTGGNGHEKDGRMWVYNTISQWHKQFPFWSEVTIKRALTSLRNKGVVLATDRYNDWAANKTLWYSIDHEELDQLAAGIVKGDTADTPSDQNELIVSSDPIDEQGMSYASAQNELPTVDQNELPTSAQIELSNNQRIPKNTTKNTRERTGVEEMASLDSSDTSTKRVLPPLNTAIVEECYAPGYVLTDGDWTRVSMAARVLTTKNATPEQVHERVAIYKSWGDYSLSPQAIAKHWDRLGEEPVSFAKKKEGLREDRNRNVFANFLAGGD